MTNQDSASRATANVSPLSIVDQQSSYEKGEDFEQYIKNLFCKKSGRFELLSPNSTNAALYGKAAGALFPDLKFLFYTRTRNYKFAIECKWRKTFINGKLKWAEPYQLRNYVLYEKQNHVPVFIAIGVGGLPNGPEKLFVTPLSAIEHKTEVSEQDLIPYKRNPKHRFFYDARQLKLF